MSNPDIESQMKIILIRHGNPDINHKTNIKPKELAEWFDQYNKVSIRNESKPCVQAVQVTKDINYVVCSDYIRSINSAEILKVKKINEIDKGFREVDIPLPDWSFPKIDLRIMVLIFRVLWFLGYSKNCESLKEAKSRAGIAADKLIDYAEKYESVLFVGHAIFNHLISKELRKRGLKGPSNPGRRYWKYGEYIKDMI